MKTLLFLMLLSGYYNISVVHAGPPFGIEEAQWGTCGYTSMTARYSSRGAQYTIAGTCREAASLIDIPWSAEGGFNPANGDTKEAITISGPAPYRGTLRTTMSCTGVPQNFDPWLGATHLKCRGAQLSAQGEFATKTGLVNQLMNKIQQEQRPFTSAHPYDRNGLMAKRAADLKAEQEAAQRQAALKPGVQTGMQRTTLWPAPEVIEPRVNGQFFGFKKVLIKVTPPKTAPAYTNYVLQILNNSQAAKAQWGANGFLSSNLIQRGQLEAGFIIPENWFRAPLGAWAARVRVSRAQGGPSSPADSDPSAPWTDWRRFNVLAAPAAGVQQRQFQLQR